MKTDLFSKLRLLATALAASLILQASLPEPDNIIYGQIVINNTPVTTGQTSIVIEARRTANGAPIATYRMGSDVKYGSLFSLHIPLEAFTPLASGSSSVAGNVLYIVVRDGNTILGQKSYVVGGRGLTTRSDFIIGSPDADQNGLPDAWEIANFQGAADPNGDPDGDGQINLQEFIQNTNPNLKDGFLLHMQPLGSQIQITFNAIAATGPGYENLERFYAIESTTNFTAGWIPLPGYSNILGANQTVVYMNPTTNSPIFYRGKVWLVAP